MSIRTVTLVLLAALCAAAPAAAQSVPNRIAYQGKLNNSLGQPVPDGTHNVQFAMYTVASGGTAFWWSFSQGVQTAGGIFSAVVGDMTADTLAGKTEVWLETIVDGQALSPRVKLTSNPYALICGRALAVADGAVTSAGLATGAVTTAKIADGAVTAGKILNGTILGVNVAPNQLVKSLNGLRDDVTLAAGSNITITPSGNTLTIAGTGGGGGLTLPYEGIVSSSLGAFVVKNTGSGTAGRFENTNVSSSTPALDAQTNGEGPAFRAIGAIAADMYGKVLVTGLVGVGKTSPGRPLDVYTTAYGDAIRAETTSTDGNGVYGIANTGSNAYGVYGYAGDGFGVRGYSPNNTGVWGSGSLGVRGEGGTGVKGVGSTWYGVEGEGPTAVKGTGSSIGVLGVHSSTGNYTELGRQWDALHAVAWTGNAGYFQATAGAGDGVYAVSEAANKSGVAAFQGNSGGYAVYARNNGSGNMAYIGGSWCGIYAEAGGSSTIAAAFKGNVRLTSKATGNIVAEIGEGLDYAEGFDVSDSGEIGPGSVLVIDPDNPGKLTISRKAYDKRVAGIVAGGKGLGSGVRLGAEQFDHDVALAGRVYCNVDATGAAVEPGDLLTTSDRPGHAMKVTDHTRAQGAILGKAMERLEKGATGQILVLVTLQ